MVICLGHFELKEHKMAAMAAAPYHHYSLFGGTPLTMEDYMSGISCSLLDVEEMLLQQRGAREAPFSGMDKSGRGVCIRNEQGTCAMGAVCPLRHIIGDKAVVCKHWLRGLCKKGDQCEFLHEYDLMACSNRECPFRHIDPESKIKDCPWYDRGFCRHGPFCKHRHRRRVLCPNYLAGFCPDGRECKYAHPSFNIPPVDTTQILRARGQYNIGIVCHNCHERGHKATYCPHLPTQTQLPLLDSSKVNAQISQELVALSEKKALSDVTCYKCGEKGHYANRCHKGLLAFLSNTAYLAHEQREKDEKEARGNGQQLGILGKSPQVPQLKVPNATNKSGEMLR
ncbi:unnamed protein product [Litomosoides sigmodontis]|uniref:Cleavage and polyadenylation specificity factor subunit 4 n=1 Tax=Litomosoides sigmodontis TaxID=42156 RepID=A0A3P6SS22_LITSI|nr:unnamed protein product [Litomosoides sigmodontis]